MGHLRALETATLPSFSGSRSPAQRKPYRYLFEMMVGLINFLYSARFELPQAPIHLHGVQNATAFGPACPQQAFSPSVPISIPTHSVVSEVCASLFVPALVPIYKDLSQV
jgi:hypothetical protein